MIYLSALSILLVPILFCLQLIGFAAARRRALLLWLLLPIVLGAGALAYDGIVQLVGLFLLMPALQLSVFYIAAEIFKAASGRELLNVTAAFTYGRHALDMLVCNILWITATLLSGLLLRAILF
jgi:hypothetical protein